MTHELKCWPGFFEAVSAGIKRCEVRKADRPFAIGDTLRLREWFPLEACYTGRAVEVRVLHIVAGGAWGIDRDYCVMSIQLEGTEPCA